MNFSKLLAPSPKAYYFNVIVPSYVELNAAYTAVNKYVRLVVHKTTCSKDVWRCSTSRLSAWDITDLTERACTIELLAEMKDVFYYVSGNFLLINETNIRGNAWGSHSSGGVPQCKGFE